MKRRDLVNVRRLNTIQGLRVLAFLYIFLAHSPKGSEAYCKSGEGWQLWNAISS